MPKQAVIYTRISRDEAGTGAGVARQEQDCRALCERKKWTVVGVCSDNDVSAFSGRRRPAYETLLGLLSAGTVNAVVAWAPERLHRSPRELEDFLELLEQTGASVETVKAGAWDVSSSHGRLVARMLGAVSRAESERTGERVSRAHQQAMQQGRWRGAVPYGMRRTATPGVPEADPTTRGTVIEIFERVVRGDALTRIASELNESGITPRRGRGWTHTGIQRLIASPALGGLVAVDGELSKGAFVGVVEPDLWHRAQVSIRTRPRGEARRPREKLTLLGGLLRCAEHEEPCFGGGTEYSRVYGAQAPGRCHVRIPRDPADTFMADLVIARLSRPDAAELLLPPSPGSGSDEEVAALRQRREQIADLVADGLLPAATARTRLEALQAQLAELEPAPSSFIVSVRDLADPAAAWARWTMPQRREVLRWLFADIRLEHATASLGPRADIRRIIPIWTSASAEVTPRPSPDEHAASTIGRRATRRE